MTSESPSQSDSLDHKVKGERELEVPGVVCVFVGESGVEGDRTWTDGNGGKGLRRGRKRSGTWDVFYVICTDVSTIPVSE